jgi:pimeloyl-ACP methyl ester carboxylesterase
VIDLDDSRNLNLKRILASSNKGLLCVRTSASRSALLFIHGYKTNSLKTWGNRDSFFWPHQLGKDCELGVYCFQYSNGIAKGGAEGQPTVSEAADSLAWELQSLNLDRVIIVAHSFGGILAKEFLTRCLGAREPVYRALANRIFGLCAISCPNRGHWLARLTGILCPGIFQSDNSRLLYPDNGTIIDIDRNFIDTRSKLPNFQTVTITESGYLHHFFRINTKDAMIVGSKNLVSTKNHKSIVYDLSPDSAEYRWIKEFALDRKIAFDHTTLLT